jgi:peptidyl-prolyl cis-trans isomerase C
VKTRSVLLLMAAFVCLAFSAAAAPDDPVIARVNGVDIKQSDLDFASAEIGPRLSSLSPKDRQQFLVQYLVESELVAAAGRSENLDKTDSFPARMKYYERRALRDAYLEGKVYKAVTEDEAKKAYDDTIKQAKPEAEIHVRHILVDTEDEAKAIAERLKKGEDFATVAKEKSKDPNSEGGDLGFIGRGQTVKPFEDAAFALSVGQISEPVHTPFGWHIIKVEEKRDQPPPAFDQVKDEIITQLVQQKAQEVVGDLRKAAKIEIVDPELKKAMEDAATNGDAGPSPEDTGPSPEEDNSSGDEPSHP